MKENILTSLLCFIPSIFGLIIWNYLPSKLAIHFGLFGVDGYGSKLIVVFLIPLMYFILDNIYSFITNKFPDWLNPTFKSTKLKMFLFPILSTITFLLAISNSI